MSQNSPFSRRDFMYALAGLGGSILASQLPSQKVLAATRISGAGASFPAPLYNRWFLEYNKVNPQVEVSYQSVGSGAGVQQFIQRAIDFGASDVAMTDQEMAQVNGGVVLLPMTAGSIVVAYNLPGANIKLTRQQLTDVFLGKIKNWNQIGGPNQAIQVVYRSDGSGTTGVFTKHLSAISPQWKSSVGEGKSVQWPVGQGAKGNEGVTAQIQQTRGAIGYVEYGYAKTNNLAIAALQNKAGRMVTPSPANSAAALSKVQLPSNLRAFITDPDGANSYPIVTYSWILANKKYSDPKKAKAIKDTLQWCLRNGQRMSADLGYIPLPANVVARVSQAINTIQ